MQSFPDPLDIEKLMVSPTFIFSGKSQVLATLKALTSVSPPDGSIQAESVISFPVEALITLITRCPQGPFIFNMP